MKCTWVRRAEKRGTSLSAFFLIGAFFTTLCHPPALLSLNQKFKIAVVTPETPNEYRETCEGIKEVLQWEFVPYKLPDNPGKIPSFFDNLMKEELDLIITLGGDSFQTVKKQEMGVPILYSAVQDPSRYIQSGEKYPGITIEAGLSKKLEEIKKTFPNTEKVGLVYYPKSSKQEVEKARTYTRELDMDLVALSADTLKDSLRGVETLRKEKVDVLAMLPDEANTNPLVFEKMKRVSLRNGIPILGVSKRTIREGAFFALTVDFHDIGRQTGELARAVLNKEETVSYTPIPPRKTGLAINGTLLRKMDFEIPKEILKRAEVIER